MGLIEKQTLKELMIKYGFKAPDMTVTEFAEDILPSAQPEVAKDTNVPSNDCISRQAAIDAMEKWLFEPNDNRTITEVLSALPSAQPEQLPLQKFTEYQIEWLTSHCDIELEPVLEGWIVRFLRDTAECYEAERHEDG